MDQCDKTQYTFLAPREFCCYSPISISRRLPDSATDGILPDSPFCGSAFALPFTTILPTTRFVQFSRPSVALSAQTAAPRAHNTPLTTPSYTRLPRFCALLPTTLSSPARHVLVTLHHFRPPHTIFNIGVLPHTTSTMYAKDQLLRPFFTFITPQPRLHLCGETRFKKTPSCLPLFPITSQHVFIMRRPSLSPLRVNAHVEKDT